MVDDPDPYVSYKELIRQGWFESKYEELQNILQVLVADGKLTSDQLQKLLEYSRDKRREDTRPPV